MRRKCSLTLSNGQSFEGELIGAPLLASGEMVFTTGMVGYSEALTDPSYFGQILVFTYPLIGNYGIPEVPKSLKIPIPTGFESAKVHASAVIVSVDCAETFHWRSLQSLDKWLTNEGVPGIVGIDTRHLVHMIRGTKNLLGTVTPESKTGQRAMGKTFEGWQTKGPFLDPSEFPILEEVSVRTPQLIQKGSPHIAIVDCGVKWNIIRQLLDQGCGVELIPFDYDLSKVKCDGWLISNGPGDPKQTGPLIGNMRNLLDKKKPILGICLGHQLLSLAAGMNTVRMAYGHRSHNQPVQLVGTRRGFISSQNHGYVVEDTSLPQGWDVWFRNANDQTVEGIRHKDLPYRSVQFHPEAAGGPRDTAWIIREFVDEVKTKCQ